MLSPGVYLLHQGKKVKYVGASAYGVSRALSSSHHKIVKELRAPGAWLEWLPMPSAMDAFTLEDDLIARLGPPLNDPSSVRARKRRQQRTLEKRAYIPLNAEERKEIKARLNL